MTQTVNIGFLRTNLSGYPLEVIIYGLRAVVIAKFRRENEPCILFFRRAPIHAMQDRLSCAAASAHAFSLSVRPVVSAEASADALCRFQRGQCVAAFALGPLQQLMINADRAALKVDTVPCQTNGF